ncbi:MAG: SPW repeat protein [bacterium]|nr:SPW repeat protein [bacterium]
MKLPHWSLIALGGWLLLSPWILGYASVNLALWNSITVGALVVLAAFWSVSPPGNA